VYIDVPDMGVREHGRSGLFFYSPHGRSIWDIEVVRARGIANILLFVFPPVECSPMPSPIVRVLRMNIKHQGTGKASYPSLDTVILHIRHVTALVLDKNLQ
jgi:hypothetical protein